MTRHFLVAAFVGAVAGFLLTVGPPAFAVPTGTSCSAAGCFTDGVGDQRVNSGVATDVLEVELLVTTVTRNRVLAANEQLAGAKSLYCQNRSSATAYITFDAVSLTTTGSTGWKLASGDEKTWDIDGTTFGPSFGANATATMSTGAGLWCSWLK